MSDRIITHASVFSGIGASEIAAEMLGWKNLLAYMGLLPTPSGRR